MPHASRLVRGAVVLTTASLLALATACEAVRNPLDVETTSRIPAENMETPANAQLLVDGAIADFECAFAAYVVQSATVGDEFIYAQQTAARTPSDRRNVLPTDQEYSAGTCAGFGIYVPLQTARATAENVLRYLTDVWTDEQVPNRTRLISVAAAYAGYSYVLLGEGFCTMAISRINPDRSVEYGGEIQRDSVFKLAISRFTQAITAASAVSPGTAADTAIMRMAYLGRARAKLNLQDWEGARADAQQIPTGYVRNATYSDAVTRRNNFVWSNNAITNRAMSIAEPYRSMTDARVSVVQGTAAPTVSATGIHHYYQTKYANQGSPIPIARYHEAQLIIAETYIRQNQLALALPILQASRTRGGQGAFTGVTQADYLAELVSQRRRELFLEGHHLGDIIRYDIALIPPEGTPYHFGGSYGNQICFPLPASERLNNPRIGS